MEEVRRAGFLLALFSPLPSFFVFLVNFVVLISEYAFPRGLPLAVPFGINPASEIKEHVYGIERVFYEKTA